MKHLTTILLFVFIIESVVGQEFKYLKPNLDDSCTIISKVIDTKSSFEQLVYIDSKVNTELKEKVFSFDISKSEKLNIQKDYNDIIRNHNKKIKKFNIGLPEKWINIYKYKGQWVLYDDIESVNIIMLSDSSISNFEMDGIYVNVISQYNEKGNKYYLNILGKNFSEPEINIEYELIIHIIDFDSKIAVWEYNRKDKKEYQLMIPEYMKSKFPMVEILATDLVGNESSMFDKIDFSKLLK